MNFSFREQFETLLQLFLQLPTLQHLSLIWQQQLLFSPLQLFLLLQPQISPQPF